jgi:hypothetical protein
MQSSVKTVEQYLNELPEDRKEPMKKLRETIVKALPKGFEEVMDGMIIYQVPLSTYPAGYLNDPKKPLPFIGLASQKNFISVYHMGVYRDETLYKWFTTEYSKRSKYKLDMGKSCLRLKKFLDIPYDLIGELVSKTTVKEWIAQYEESYNQKHDAK